MDHRQSAPQLSTVADSDAEFQQGLLGLLSIGAGAEDHTALVRLLCRKSREILRVSGAYCWKMVSNSELQPVAADGFRAEQFADIDTELKDSTQLLDSVRNRKTVYRNGAELKSLLPKQDRRNCSALAAPLVVAGEVVGGLVFIHTEHSDYFNDDIATRASIIAGVVAASFEAVRMGERARQERSRTESLVGVALELNSSLRLSEFAQKFTARAATLMGAKSALLALSQGNVLEAVACHGERPDEPAVLRPFNHALAQAISKSAIVCGETCEVLGNALAPAMPWKDVTIARLKGGAAELVGVLCLGDRGGNLTPGDEKLLKALTSHASVALENLRLFTRMDHANRHWMEVFDSITDFIVVHDEANQVLRVNRSFADFIGVRPSELIGVSMRALSMGEDGEQFPCPFCRAQANTVDEYVHPLSERTYLISTSRIHGATNDGMQVIHVLKDITDRREAERRYRELFDNIQEGLYFSSPEGRFIEVNDALVRMLGYDSREELLQVDIPSRLYLSPDHRRHLVHAMTSGKVLRNCESVLRRKDGTLIYTLENAFAVTDAQGRILQYRGLMMDITELKNFQAELQRERDFSSKILNNTQSLILVVDTAGLISYANRRCYEAGNFRNKNLLGRPLTDIVAPERKDEMLAALQATLDGQQTDNLELPIALASGQVAQFSTNLSPMRDEQGNVASIVVVMTDITDAASVRAKLIHTEKMAAVGQLVSGVAHEVNNPLTAVLGFTDLLLDDDDVPENAKKSLRIVLQEAQRTRQIVQNLLSFARQTPPKRQPVQVNDILRRTLALRAYDFVNRDVTMVEKFDELLPETVGDAHQLQQVFLNILNNAYDAISESGRPGCIEIETSADNGFAEIRFRDNGNGITHPERIFDPFFTTKGVGKGTGLGLSICYGIVREHGGEITCGNNEGPDARGATFLVRLPLITQNAARAFGAHA